MRQDKGSRGEEMVVVWRAAVVRACEVDRKKDYIYVKVIVSIAWKE